MIARAGLVCSLLAAIALAGCVGESIVGGPRDAASADVIADDLGPQRCAGDGDCAADPLNPVCDTATGRCVPCTPARDRCPGGRYCTLANTCATGCRDDAACADGVASRCDLSSRRCVQCARDAHCPAGSRCVGAVCAPGCTDAQPCPTAQTCCDGSCVDTSTSTASCGACGSRCAPARAQPRCEAGVCAIGACAAPYADCDGRADNGCEVDTTLDADHCGACGTTCGARANASVRCAAGRCEASCDEGFADCDGDPSTGCEVDTRADARHCGACARACTVANGVAACVMGRCAVGSCEAGRADCNGDASDGCETATASNDDACGGCGIRCGAGQLCEAGACVSDCRRSPAAACAAGTECDFSDGVCRASGSRCVLSGEFVPCGAQRCGPGAICNPRTMTCAPSLACGAVRCEDGSARCWGVSCPCERPAASCTTLAPSAVPTSFLSGAFGFDIDDACNLYTATMLSGPDYVRRLDTAGLVTTWTSVANLNMGEVAVQRRGVGGSGPQAVNVAFTYICCASCGCASSPPQGVGHVQMDGALPVVVPAVVSAGRGPFGVGYLDTGPYGLSISALGEFFVGNVRANGDFFRYDTDTRSITPVATLPARVTASTAFDLDTMLVALEGGELYLVDRAPGGTVSRLGSLGADVQSVRRDYFTGRFYASLRDRRIVSFRADGTGVSTETMTARGSRVALSPDGYLYVLLAEGGPISRVALPSSR